jgi:protein gp37
MVFVNSMSDLFHKNVPTSFVIEVARVMQQSNWHIFQVLTKRANRLNELLSGSLRFVAEAPHIWWGVSVEDRKYGVPRIDLLRRSRARVKFLSVEPLLEDLGEIDLAGIDWVIVGGESGPGARPMKMEWVTSIRDQCFAAGIPFFFKQWGGVQKSKHGRILDGMTYDQFPEKVTADIPTLGLRREYARVARSRIA